MKQTPIEVLTELKEQLVLLANAADYRAKIAYQQHSGPNPETERARLQRDTYQKTANIVSQKLSELLNP